MAPLIWGVMGPGAGAPEGGVLSNLGKGLAFCLSITATVCIRMRTHVGKPAQESALCLPGSGR